MDLLLPERSRFSALTEFTFLFSACLWDFLLAYLLLSFEIADGPTSI